MKIAFIHHSFILGSGIDTVIYELSKRLARKYDVTIFTFNNEYKDNIDGVNIHEIYIPFNRNRIVNAVFSPIFLNKIAELRILLKRYDVINTHIYPANIIPILPKKIKGPLNIVTEWGLPPKETFELIHEKAYILFIKNVHKHVTKKADFVIAPCEFINKWIKNEYGVKNAVTMYLDGINFDIFNKNKVSCDSIYNKYPFLEDSLVILYVGRLSPHKRVDMLIRSFKLVKKYISDVRLVIVGRKSFPRYFEYLNTLVKSWNLQKDVIFTGVVPWEDLPKYYSICEVYATCSIWEGFLRAEAFAMEKPMVAFDCAANPETIINGKTGYLVKDQTPEAFARVLIKLLLNDKLRRKMGKNGYEWAKENLDFDIIAKNFANFIEEKLERMN